MTVTHEPVIASDVGNSLPTDSDLVATFRELPRGQCVRLFANLSALAWNAFGSDNEAMPRVLQFEMIDALKDAVSSPRIAAALRANERSVVLHPEQAALAVKFALLHASAPDIDRTNVTERARYSEGVLNALVSINSLMLTAQVSIAQKNILGLGLRIAHFQRREGLANVLARYHYLFDWADSSEGRASSEHLPLRADFPRLLGWTVDEYFFAFMAAYAQVGTLNRISDIGEKGAVFALSTFLQGTARAGEVERFILANAVGIDDFKTQFLVNDENLYSSLSLMPLLSKPFVRLEDGAVCIVSPKYIENAFGTAIFHRLADAYKADGGDKRRGRFTSFFGNYLEAYVAQLMQEATPSTSKRRIVREVLFTSKAGSEAKSTDVVAIEERNAVFLEVVAKRPRVVQTLRDVEADAVRKDLDQMLVEKAKEIGERLVDFVEKRFDLSETQHSDLDRIFPIVVVVEPMFTELGIAQDTELRLAGAVGLKDVEPLQIIDIESLEALGLPLQRGALLSEILSTKLNSAITAARGMKDYLVERGYELTRTPAMQSRVQAAMRAVLDQAAAFGVPGAGQPDMPPP